MPRLLEEIDVENLPQFFGGKDTSCDIASGKEQGAWVPLSPDSAMETKILIVSLGSAAKVEKVLSLELRKRREEHHLDIPLLSEDASATGLPRAAAFLSKEVWNFEASTPFLFA